MYNHSDRGREHELSSLMKITRSPATEGGLVSDRVSLGLHEETKHKNI